MTKKVIGMFVGEVIFGFALLSIFAVTNEGGSVSQAQADKPELRVEKEMKPKINTFGIPTGDFVESAKIINVGRLKMELESVVFNDRIDCASKYEPIQLPMTLDIGDFVLVDYVCSGTIVEAKIVTDHGTATYTWK
jgi:hypothetical protein